MKRQIENQGCCGPGKTLATFAAIVSDYIRHRRRAAAANLRRLRKVPLRQAIEIAARSEDTDGRRLAHQRRLSTYVLAAASDALGAKEGEIRRCRDFAALHDLVKATIGSLRGIGDLAIYDIAVSIGANLRLEPALVYLHAGTRQGALALGFNDKTLNPAALPPAFRRLRPREIEDVLCIYRDDLLRIRRAEHKGQ